MSAALDLIRELEAAGGRVRLVGDRLRVKPRDLPDGLIERLRQHKPELLALLSVRERRGRFRAAHAGPAGGDSAGWRRWLANEAERRRRFGRTPDEAAIAAFNEALNCWLGRHGAEPLPGRCAGCGKPLAGERIIALPCGAAVHGQACLIEYGKLWKSAAVADLTALSILAPEGWTS